MTFCGQCGFLLPPGATTCPHCGVPTPYNRSAEVTNTNDVTIKTHPDAYQDGAGPHTPTVRNLAPITPVFTDTSYPVYLSPPIPHSGDKQQPSESTYPQQGASHPGFAPPPGTGYDTATTPDRQRKSNLLLKLVILIILLLASATLTLFVMQPGKLQSLLGNHTAALPTMQPSQIPALTPEQEAQAVIIQYYTNINNKDYHAAYNLWANYPLSYDSFAQGFAHTQHDDIGFGKSVQQNDGTVRVPVTITATSDAPSGTGTQQNQYQGYYIVGRQPSGSWKIITANILAA